MMRSIFSFFFVGWISYGRIFRGYLFYRWLSSSNKWVVDVHCSHNSYKITCFFFQFKSNIRAFDNNIEKKNATLKENLQI